MSTLTLLLLLALACALLGLWRSDMVRLALQNLLSASRPAIPPSVDTGRAPPPEAPPHHSHSAPPQRPEIHRSGHRH